MTDNRVRLLADVLSIDAWHTAFTSNSNEATVHAELSFQNGRVGGDSIDLPFTFGLRLKKAVVTIKVDPPLQILKRSIARSIPDSHVEISKVKRVREGIATSYGGEAGISLKRFVLAMTGSSKRESDVSIEDEAKVLERVPAIIVKPQPGSDREYRWQLEPSFLPALDGQPWDPIEAPRLTIKSSDKEADPTIKIFVSCKREDLDIYDLKLKDDNLDAKLSQIVYRDMNEAAAIQYIKHLLELASLEPSRLDNRFSSIMIADILVTPEMSDEI